MNATSRAPAVSFLQVPCSSGSLLYVWCTLVTLEPNSHVQQRVVGHPSSFPQRTSCSAQLSSDICGCEPVSGGLQSVVCHEEPPAGSSHPPYREEESGTEGEPADSRPGTPGAPGKCRGRHHPPPHLPGQVRANQTNRIISACYAHCTERQ